MKARYNGVIIALIALFTVAFLDTVIDTGGLDSFLFDSALAYFIPFGNYANSFLLVIVCFIAGFEIEKIPAQRQPDKKIQNLFSGILIFVLIISALAFFFMGGKKDLMRMVNYYSTRYTVNSGITLPTYLPDNLTFLKKTVYSGEADYDKFFIIEYKCASQKSSNSDLTIKGELKTGNANVVSNKQYTFSERYDEYDAKSKFHHRDLKWEDQSFSYTLSNGQYYDGYGGSSTDPACVYPEEELRKIADSMK